MHLEEGHRERLGEAQRAAVELILVQAYAAPYPKWMISKVLGAHRRNRKVSRVLQIAVKNIPTMCKDDDLAISPLMTD